MVFIGACIDQIGKLKYGQTSAVLNACNIGLEKLIEKKNWTKAARVVDKSQ